MSSFGTPRLHLRLADSTNLRARALAEAGAPHGMLVTATAQSAGRGRQGRHWSAPAGRALLMSLVLRAPPTLLSLRAGLAVAAVAQQRDSRARAALVKWPNDVLLDGRKAAGILVESRPQDDWAVLGVGLNVAVRDGDLDADIAARATGLGGEPADVEAVLGELLQELQRALRAAPGSVLSDLRARDVLRGRPVRWATGSGIGAGLDDEGRLLVNTGTEIIALGAGDVHLEVS